MRFKARRLFKFAQRFPTSTLGQKINLVWGQKSPVTHRKNFKEFLDFPKIAQQHSRGSYVRWKRCIKPKIDQQILGTRRFTKMNTVLSCAPSTQFHLGTDVRYHYVPKYTVFHVSFKIAVHWKKLASSNSCKNVGTSTSYDDGLQYGPTRRLRYPGYSEKLRKNCLFAHPFGRHVFPIFSTSIAQIGTKLGSLCQ